MRLNRVQIIGFVLLLVGGTWGVRGESRVVVSQSGQFTVVGQPMLAHQPVAEGRLLPSAFNLDPQFLAISAERVKTSIYSLLQMPPGHQGRIQINLLPGRRAGFPISLIQTHYTDGWKFQLNLPEEVDETKLTQALVQVVLMEIAQRNASRTPELPPWLVEGITENLMYSVGPSLIVRSPSQTGVGKVTSHGFGWKYRLEDSLSATRSLLGTNTPPSYTQLSFGTYNVNDPVRRETYQAACHLFVRGLLSLPEGSSGFVTFLQTLPMTLNWQTAFFRAYSRHFQRPLDVEKWWALKLFEFTSRDHRQTWTPLVSLTRLEVQLITHLEWHSSTNSLPSPRSLRLQELLRDRTLDVQKQALTAKLFELQALQVNLAPDVAEIAERYREIVSKFLEGRNRLQTQFDTRLSETVRFDNLVRPALRELDQLDATRRAYLTKLSPQTAR